MYSKIENNELASRLKKFHERMNNVYSDWDTAIIMGKVNQYYFTGTMQDGMLVIRRSGEIDYFVRRSYERAIDESPLINIYRMKNYRDAADIIGTSLNSTYLETEIVTLGIVERLKRYFTIKSIHSIDKILTSLRSVKTEAELKLIERSAMQQNDFLINVVPALLREGVSEADSAAELLEKMVKAGRQAISRFSQFQSEALVGQISFGENSLYPTYFDSPDGNLGMSAAVPLLGSHKRKLKKGDLVFIDICDGIDGYHSDKTQVYMFGTKPSEEVAREHRKCMEVQKRLVELIKPGAIPSEIYNTVIGEQSSDFLHNFMGFNERQVKFLGHGVGLYVDEMPVIANGFIEPISKNMVVALEPKKGLKDIGMVGVEDTYIISQKETRCISGGSRDIIVL